MERIDSLIDTEVVGGINVAVAVWVRNARAKLATVRGEFVSNGASSRSQSQARCVP